MFTLEDNRMFASGVGGHGFKSRPNLSSDLLSIFFPIELPLPNLVTLCTVILQDFNQRKQNNQIMT